MILFVVVVALAVQAQPPRLRTFLPNGASIVVENVPKASRLSLQLFASSRPSPETPSTNGMRHLLEHLLAVGRGGTIDRRLESKGAFLTAETLRDAMQIGIDAPADQLDLALSAIGEMLADLEVTQAQIDREVGIMVQEMAIRPTSGRLIAGAWTAAYGDSGLDPMGDLDVMRSATPDSLAKLHRRLFAVGNVTLSIAGPLDVDKVTASCMKLLGENALPTTSSPLTRQVGKPSRSHPACAGEARAAIVGPYDQVQTMAALAAGLSLASEMDGAFLSFTPSLTNGLIVVGKTTTTGVGRTIDALTETDVDGLYQRGKSMAGEWIRLKMKDAAAVAQIRGWLLCQGRDARPEAMTDALARVRLDDFRAAVARFRDDRAVSVVGSGS